MIRWFYFFLPLSHSSAFCCVLYLLKQTDSAIWWTLWATQEISRNGAVTEQKTFTALQVSNTDKRQSRLAGSQVGDLPSSNKSCLPRLGPWNPNSAVRPRAEILMPVVFAQRAWPLWASLSCESALADPWENSFVLSGRVRSQFQRIIRLKGKYI